MFLFSLTFTSLTSSIHNDVKSPLEIYRNSLNNESTSVFSIEYGPQIEEENVTQGGEVSIKTTYKLSVKTPKYKIRVTLGDKSVEKELEKTETEKNITINITIPDNTSVGNFTFNVSVVIANTPEEVTNHSVYVNVIEKITENPVIGPNLYYIIGGAVGGAILLIILVIVVICCIVKKKKDSDSSEGKQEYASNSDNNKGKTTSNGKTTNEDNYRNNNSRNSKDHDDTIEMNEEIVKNANSNDDGPILPNNLFIVKCEDKEIHSDEEIII